MLRAKVAQLGLIPMPRSQEPGPLAARSDAPLDPITQTALDLETALQLNTGSTRR
jgi:hypothetical protein